MASFAGIAAVCLLILFQPAISVWLSADYATATAETREVHLQDGSVVYLDADSAIEISFEPALRQVRLLAGAAFFEVEPDADRPFRVRAGAVDTTVLGTAFDVKMASESVIVAVNHGRVSVASLDDRLELQNPLEAGDWVRVGSSGQVERGSDAPELAGGWRSGMLVVKDRPVAEVLDEIARHYRGTILLSDSALGRQRVTGVYDLRKPSEALQALAQAHGARLRQVSSWVSILSTY